EEDLHDGVARRQAEFAEDVLREGFELGEERVGRVQLEVVVEDVVPAAGGVLARRGVRGGGRGRRAGRLGPAGRPVGGGRVRGRLGGRGRPDRLAADRGRPQPGGQAGRGG